MNNPFETIDARLCNIENLLLDLKHGSDVEKTSEPDKLLTIQEAAQLINLSVPTIYGLVSRSEIPVCKKGKRLYFSKLDLISWIRSGRKRTNDEISTAAEQYLKKVK